MVLCQISVPARNAGVPRSTFLYQNVNTSDVHVSCNERTEHFGCLVVSQLINYSEGEGEGLGNKGMYDSLVK